LRGIKKEEKLADKMNELMEVGPDVLHKRTCSIELGGQHKKKQCGENLVC